MPKAPEKPRHIKRQILVIEDNDINREMLKEILSDRYRVLEATNGQEGLTLLHEHLPDLSLILLDVHMPVMDGYAFLEQYRQDEQLSGIPVIVTTGSRVSEDEERCLALGASDFVTKPYNPRIILRRVEALIRLRESIAALQAVEYDSLTGLYTRNAFHHHAGNWLRYADEVQFDMLMINVEDFSYINERYGEAVGSALLRHIGNVLRSSYLPSVVSCRYHADRFILMRKHIPPHHKENLQKLDKLIHTNAPLDDFTVKFALYDNVPSSIPVGVLCSRLSLAVETLRHQYRQDVVSYDEAMSQRIDRMHKIEECMESALEEGQFRVYYQPKHDAATGRIAGAEALVRWIHPEYGFLSPGEFLPLLEQNGFITNLDLYVWRTVCRDLKAWREDGISLLPVSVNASRRDFLSVETPEPLLTAVEENGIDKEFLHMEITESFGVGNERVWQKVAAVRNRGIRIELDDFGAGQSSLSTLHSIPIDVIKLDIGFVRALKEQKEVVRMIISLSHALGHKIVAEGVETEEQVRLLREFGCDLFQGYYYSKPIPEPEFRSYLKTHQQEEAFV